MANLIKVVIFVVSNMFSANGIGSITQYDLVVVRLFIDNSSENETWKINSFYPRGWQLFNYKSFFPSYMAPKCLKVSQKATKFFSISLSKLQLCSDSFFISSSAKKIFKKNWNQVVLRNSKILRNSEIFMSLISFTLASSSSIYLVFEQNNGKI